MKRIISALLLAIIPQARATMTRDKTTEHTSDSTLGLQSIGPYKEKLTVHLIHHTHDDVGWLKTVD